MLASTLIERFFGAIGATPMEGIEPLDLIQAVVDELSTEEIPEKLVRAAPYITTVAGTLVYAFDSDHEDDLTQLAPGLDTIRRVRGIYRPAVTGVSTSDYNYQRFPAADQNILNQRIYEGDVQIDNEERTITWSVDPGDYTDRWKLDYYPIPRLLSEASRIPVLYGWELPLVLPGMRAMHEEWTTGNPNGYWRGVFNKQKERYRGTVRNESNVPTLGSDLYSGGDSVVGAQ